MLVLVNLVESWNILIVKSKSYSDCAKIMVNFKQDKIIGVIIIRLYIIKDIDYKRVIAKEGYFAVTRLIMIIRKIGSYYI